MGYLPILYHLGLGPIGTAIAFYFLSLEPMRCLSIHLYLDAELKSNSPYLTTWLFCITYLYSAPIYDMASQIPQVADFLNAYRNWYWTGTP